MRGRLRAVCKQSFQVFVLVQEAQEKTRSMTLHPASKGVVERNDSGCHVISVLNQFCLGREQ